MLRAAELPRPMMPATLPPLSLYVHLPWCVRKCPYCDFNSYETQGALAERPYVAALLRDLDAETAFVQDRTLASLSAAARRACSQGPPSASSSTASAPGCLSRVQQRSRSRPIRALSKRPALRRIGRPA